MSREWTKEQKEALREMLKEGMERGYVFPDWAFELAGEKPPKKTICPLHFWEVDQAIAKGVDPDYAVAPDYADSAE